MGSNGEMRRGAAREISREVARGNSFFRIYSVNDGFVPDRQDDSDDVREMLPVQTARKTGTVLFNSFIVCGAVDKTVENPDARISFMGRAVVGGISRTIPGAGCRDVTLNRK